MDLNKWLGRSIGANGAKQPVHILHTPMPRCSQRPLPIRFPPTRTPLAFLFSLIHATRLAHFTLLYLIILILFVEGTNQGGPGYWWCSIGDNKHYRPVSGRYCAVAYHWTFITFPLEAMILPRFGTAVAQWLRCCATNRKVAGSLPDSVFGIFHWHNPSGRTMALESIQPLTEMSTRRISWG